MTEKEDEIQLVIKAPNQNIEDQVVKCNLEWTVGELKEYLSEEYPSKPDVLEQRLIYSGRLLHNHLHLRDILRQDENQSSIHTLHLVCNVNNHAFKSQKPMSSQNRYNPPIVQSQEASISSPDNTLRHRNASYIPLTNSYNPFPPPTSVVPPLSADSQVLAQMTAMQQMYMQYVNQYMQSMNPIMMGSANAPVFTQPSNYGLGGPNVNDIPIQRPVNHQRINGQAGAVVEENEELVNRDWFDHLFLCCRYLILFGIVYFYSTPERLMIVIVCAVIAFLYHEGWFVRTRLIQGAANIPGNQQQVPQNEINNDNETPLVNQDLSVNEDLQDGHELEAVMDGNEPPHAQNADRVNNNNQLSPLTVLSAFFASLIPEPPPPVNIN